MAIDDKITSVFLSCKFILAKTISRLVPPDEVEDIIQETYVRVYQLKSKNTIREIKPFMVKTARNLAIDYIKKYENRAKYYLDDNDEFYEPNIAINPGSELERQLSNEEFSQFCQALRALPVQCRRIFILRKIYGYSQKEVSIKLDLTESSVEKHVARGLSLCLAHMKRYYNDTLGHECDVYSTRGNKGILP